jgi:hypothetical protein
MTFKNTVFVPVEAPDSELWKYVRGYGKIHEYVDFIESTKMDDVEPAVGVLRVLKTDGGTIDETITAWDEKNMTYTFDVVGGPPFAKTIFFTFGVEKVDDKNSKLVCAVDVELKMFFSWVIPSFLLRKKLGEKQMAIIEGYKNAAENKVPSLSK